MRVMHVAECFGGGLMEMTIELAEGTVARGHAALIAHGVRPETPADLRARIDPAVELVRIDPWTRRTVPAQLRAVRELRALARDWRPDVIQLHSSFAGAVGAAALRSLAPTVFCPNAFASVLPEGSRVARIGYAVAERAICRTVSMVGAVSHSEAELAQRFGARRVRRIPNGIRQLDPDRAVVRRGGGPTCNGRPAVIATGRTVPQRQPEGAARILAAVRDVAEPRWLGGGGGARGVAGAQALTAAGVPPSGWLPREDVMDEVAQAGVYLHWTAWDGLPLSVLEAVALDVVVVASDIGPNREILGDEGVCRSEAEAIQRIRRIVTDPDFAEAQRERQRARRGEFSATAMVDGWFAAYEELLRTG